MEKVDRLRNYLGLLKIREAAYRRNVLFIGAVFLFTILVSLGTLLLTEWNARPVYLMGFLGILFLVGFLTAWARLEIVRANIELVNNLLTADG